MGESDSVEASLSLSPLGSCWLTNENGRGVRRGVPAHKSAADAAAANSHSNNNGNENSSKNRNYAGAFVAFKWHLGNHLCVCLRLRLDTARSPTRPSSPVLLPPHRLWAAVNANGRSNDVDIGKTMMCLTISSTGNGKGRGQTAIFGLFCGNHEIMGLYDIRSQALSGFYVMRVEPTYRTKISDFY